MKILSISILTIGLTTSAFGQGTILFSNFVPGEVDARFWNWGPPMGPEFDAQLFGRTPGVGEFIPLFPITTFSASAEITDRGFVVPVVVTVPDRAPGMLFEVEMRAFPGPTFAIDDPSCFARSGRVTVTLGGDGLPPAILQGLTPIQIFCIPEPRPWALAGMGLLACLLWRRFGCARRSQSPVA